MLQCWALTCMKSQFKWNGVIRQSLKSLFLLLHPLRTHVVLPMFGKSCQSRIDVIGNGWNLFVKKFAAACQAVTLHIDLAVAFARSQTSADTASRKEDRQSASSRAPHKIPQADLPNRRGFDWDNMNAKISPYADKDRPCTGEHVAEAVLLLCIVGLRQKSPIILYVDFWDSISISSLHALLRQNQRANLFSTLGSWTSIFDVFVITLDSHALESGLHRGGLDKRRGTNSTFSTCAFKTIYSLRNLESRRIIKSPIISIFLSALLIKPSARHPHLLTPKWRKDTDTRWHHRTKCFLWRLGWNQLHQSVPQMQSRENFAGRLGSTGL